MKLKKVIIILLILRILGPVLAITWYYVGNFYGDKTIPTQTYD